LSALPENVFIMQCGSRRIRDIDRWCSAQSGTGTIEEWTIEASWSQK